MMFYEDNDEGKGLISEYIFQNLANDAQAKSGPLGLKLTVSQSFLNLLESRLLTNRNNHNSDINNFDNSNGSLMALDKLKACNFPMVSMSIGQWQRYSRHEGELTAKIYYAKKKIVWEMLDGGLKSKMEILWSQISGIKVTMLHNQPTLLDIQLEQPPLFYRELDPQPRKHTNWNQTHDFTGGHAACFRNHRVVFPAGVFEKYYEKLLQCDPRLFKLSNDPFPVAESPYFDSFNPWTTIDNGTINIQASNINSMQGLLGRTHEANYYYQPSTVSLTNIENHLFGDSPMLPSNNGILQAQAETMRSLLEQENHQQIQDVQNSNNGILSYDETGNGLNVNWVDSLEMMEPMVDNNINSFVLPYDDHVDDPFSTCTAFANPWD